VHLVLQDEFLGPGDGGVRLGLFVFDDELHFRPAEVAVDVVKVELEAIDLSLADLGEDAGGRRHISDAQFLGGVRRRREPKATTLPNNGGPSRRSKVIVISPTPLFVVTFPRESGGHRCHFLHVLRFPVAGRR